MKTGTENVSNRKREWRDITKILKTEMIMNKRHILSYKVFTIRIKHESCICKPKILMYTYTESWKCFKSWYAVIYVYLESRLLENDCKQGINQALWAGEQSFVRFYYWFFVLFLQQGLRLSQTTVDKLSFSVHASHALCEIVNCETNDIQVWKWHCCYIFHYKT